MTQGETKSSIKVWRIDAGPFHRDDMDQDFVEAFPEDYQYMVEAYVEVDGEMGQTNLWFSDFTEVYFLMAYLKTHMEPLEIGGDDYV